MADQPASFEEFYAAQFHSITLQLSAYVGDLAEAQDIAQEAFCRALSKWDKIREYDEPVAWVRRVAWNLAKNRWRRLRTANAFVRKQRRDLAVAGPDPERLAFVAVLATLPEALRRAVVLYYIADLSVADIAAQEGVPVGTVKSWLHRGRAAVAGQLADQRRESRL